VCTQLVRLLGHHAAIGLTLAALLWPTALPAPVHALTGETDPNQPGPAGEPPLSTQHEQHAEPAQIAVVRLNGYFTEGPSITILSLAGAPTQTFAGLSNKLTKAAHDAGLAAVLLSIEQPILSWAQVDELRAALDNIRQSGKKTYAYLETASQLNYLLACNCDKIAMTPTGYLSLTGLAGQAVYLKNLLDKLGIEADLLQVGAFKSAAETWTETAPTHYQLMQINRLFDGLYEHLINSIATSRHMSRQNAARLIDSGPFTASEAHRAGLLDMVIYRKDFLTYLTQEMAGPVTLKLHYAEPAAKTLPADNPFALIATLQKLFSGPPEPAGNAIAVVYIDGPITLGQSSEGLAGTVVGSRTIRLALAEARADENVKAVVVRIDSPGGSATASDIIYQSLQETAQVKPVVASMGHLAASGGYYVACGAPTIIASPSTITGSVGVWGGKFVMGKLLAKLGISTYRFQRGENAQIFNATARFSLMERLKLGRQMEQFYETVKKRVAESRGDRLAEPIDVLAEGKIYTGLQACQLGMVDEIGGLGAAIKVAAEKANVLQYHIRSLPRPKNLLEMMEELFGKGQVAASGRAAAMAILIDNYCKSRPGGLLGSILLMDPAWRRAFSNASSVLTIMKDEQILLMPPYEVIINH